MDLPLFRAWGKKRLNCLTSQINDARAATFAVAFHLRPSSQLQASTAFLCFCLLLSWKDFTDDGCVRTFGIIISTSLRFESLSASRSLQAHVQCSSAPCMIKTQFVKLLCCHSFSFLKRLQYVLQGFGQSLACYIPTPVPLLGINSSGCRFFMLFMKRNGPNEGNASLLQWSLTHVCFFFCYKCLLMLMLSLCFWGHLLC